MNVAGPDKVECRRGPVRRHVVPLHFGCPALPGPMALLATVVASPSLLSFTCALTLLGVRAPVMLRRHFLSLLLAPLCMADLLARRPFHVAKLASPAPSTIAFLRKIETHCSVVSTWLVAKLATHRGKRHLPVVDGSCHRDSIVRVVL